MDIVMLAAGTSSRMGKENKMLIPFNGTSLVSYSCMQALKYLSTLEEKSSLTVVTGYRRFSLHKALSECRNFIEKTDKRIEMIEVYNPRFRSGQFSSAKTGVRNTSDGGSFFISLADMPGVTAQNYAQLSTKLGDYDAVRPFADGKPGHPVLLSSRMKDRILNAPNSSSVRQVLEKCNTLNVEVEGASWTEDIDSPQDLERIQSVN